MSKLISMSDPAYTALIAALDDYEARLCHRHHGGNEHGDETECDGWGPRRHADLEEAVDAVISA